MRLDKYITWDILTVLSLSGVSLNGQELGLSWKIGRGALRAWLFRSWFGNRCCGVSISLVDPTVLISNTENLLVEWGMGLTIDWPENPLLPSLTPWSVQPFGHIPGIHCSHDCFGYNAFEVHVSQNS